MTVPLFFFREDPQERRRPAKLKLLWMIYYLFDKIESSINSPDRPQDLEESLDTENSR